jgi:uncharacterized protein YndB with AHSA1/START domain
LNGQGGGARGRAPERHQAPLSRAPAGARRAEGVPRRVRGLLVDPAEQSTWWGTPLDFEARPGGPFRVEVIPGHIASGEFVELAEPRRLVYTWG